MEKKIPEDEWSKIGENGNVGIFIYKPSNYTGPYAINATVKKDGTSSTSSTA